MKKLITLLAAAVLTASMAASCEKREYLQSNPDVLNSRQIEILEENSLPTDMDKLDSKQQTDIKKIESAFVYLDRTYPEVEFKYLNTNTLTGLFAPSEDITEFVPVGYDKSDDRNIVKVKYDYHEKTYSDNYMLVLVREETEKAIEKYLESYFGKDNFKVYVHPAGTDLKFGDEINEENVKGSVQSTAALFLPYDSCSEEELNKFAEDYKKVIEIFQCTFRATIINRDNFYSLVYTNYTDLYKSNHSLYDISIR